MAHPADIDVKVHVSVIRHQRLGARPILQVPCEVDDEFAAELAQSFSEATGTPLGIVLSDGITVSEWVGPGRYAERRFLAAASMRRRAWWQ